MIAPTIINAVHHASEGVWRQLFGDVMVPLSARNGAPDASGFATLAMRAFGVDDTAGNGLAGLSAAGVFGIGVLVLLAVVTVLAVASLFLPFALRASRMMWVVTLSGGALAVASSRIVVAVDDDGPVAGSCCPAWCSRCLVCSPASDWSPEWRSTGSPCCGRGMARNRADTS